MTTLRLGPKLGQDATVGQLRDLGGSPTSVAGRHYQLRDAVAEPKPVQPPHPPIWASGSGPKRTLRIAARHADVWNAAGGAPDEIAARR